MQTLCRHFAPNLAHGVYCAAARQAAARPPTLHRRSSAACSFTASFPASSSAGHGHGRLHPDGDGGGVDGAELGFVREEADAAEVWAAPPAAARWSAVTQSLLGVGDMSESARAARRGRGR
jgi:hypothetical protein